LEAEPNRALNYAMALFVDDRSELRRVNGADGAIETEIQIVSTWIMHSA
jgi:hypothetical protein